MKQSNMDARYTGVFQPTVQQQRQETLAYYSSLQAAQKRKSLANAYLAQQQQQQVRRAHAQPKPEYRCEQCGI